MGGNRFRRSFDTSNLLTEAGVGASSSRLDGDSHPGHRPQLLARPRTCLMRGTNPYDHKARGPFR